MSAFTFFCKEMRPALPADLSFGDKSKRLGEEWAKLEDKSKFQELADEHKRNAPPKEKKKTTTTTDDAAPEDVEGSKKKKKRKKTDEESTEPKKKRPPSGYLLFLSDHRATLKEAEKELKSKELMARGAAAWRDLSEEDKETWKAKASAKTEEVA